MATGENLAAKESIMLTKIYNYAVRIVFPPVFLGMILFSPVAHARDAAAQTAGAGASGSLSLPGTWTHCNRFEKTSTEFKWTFTGTTFVSIKGDYTNNSCSGPPADGYSELYSGSYVIGTQAGSSSGMNTTLLDLTVKKAFSIPMPPYGIYTIYAIHDNVLYFGDTRTGPDAFSVLTRPGKLQIDDGDYLRIE